MKEVEKLILNDISIIKSNGRFLIESNIDDTVKYITSSISEFNLDNIKIKQITLTDASLELFTFYKSMVNIVFQEYPDDLKSYSEFSDNTFYSHFDKLIDKEIEDFRKEENCFKQENALKRQSTLNLDSTFTSRLLNTQACLHALLLIKGKLEDDGELDVIWETLRDNFINERTLSQDCKVYLL